MKKTLLLVLSVISFGSGMFLPSNRATVYSSQSESPIQAVAWRPNANQIALGRQDGTVEILAFSAQDIYLIRQDDGESQIFHLPSPDDDLISGISVTVSPDGRWLSATPKGSHLNKLRYVLDLTNPSGEWQEVPDDYPETGVRIIYFVQGMDD